MFQGETAITVDDKGRVAIPGAQRDAVSACGTRLVITYNPFEAGCLFLYPQDVWEKVRDQVNALPGSLSAHRRLQRNLVGSAAPVELDANGRISIPSSHRNAVEIDKKAVLLGMGDKFELWSEHARRADSQQPIGDDDLTPQMLELKL